MSLHKLAIATLALFTLPIVTACSRKDSTSSGNAASSVSSPPSSNAADDYGPSSDVTAVRSAWGAEASGTDTVAQVLVVQNYGFVELRGGPNSPMIAVFHKDSTGTWKDQGLKTGPLAPCGFNGSLPDQVVQELFAHDPRLAADARQDPNAGCSGTS